MATPETISLPNMRIGSGFDVHKLVPDKPLVLGGCQINFPFGLLAHSDGDVLLHAIIDALLGAAAMGDIGRLFPDTDPAYKDANSLSLLKDVYTRLTKKNISVVNIDATVICQAPKISPYVETIKMNISAALGNMDTGSINIKGTTTENLGFTGRGEGIAAQAIALVILGQGVN